MYNDFKAEKKTKELLKKDREKIKKERRKKTHPNIYREEYEIVEHLMHLFTKRRDEAKTLIEIVFPSPQLTNNKFVEEIEDIYKDFFKVYNNLNLFFSFYPEEDDRSKKIIEEETKKLSIMYNRINNIVAELSILTLNNNSDISFKDVEEETERDIKEIRDFSKNDYEACDKTKEYISGKLKKSTKNTSFLERNPFGYNRLGFQAYQKERKICQNCNYFTILDKNKEPYCMWFHHSPNPNADACPEFERKK